MATVALFCLSRSLAHASRVVAVARRLTAAGHTCVLHGAPGWLTHPMLQCAGVSVVVHDEPDMDDVLAPSRGKRPGGNPAQVLARALTADRTAIIQSGSSVVIVDNRRSAGLAAEALGIPWLSLTGALLLGPHCALAPTAADVARVCGPVLGIAAADMRQWGRLASLEDAAPVGPQAVPLSPSLRQLIADHGARSRSFAHELCIGDHTLVLDSHALVPTQDLPLGVDVVGPILASGGHRPDLPDVAGARVWLTAGATGDADLVPVLKRHLERWGISVLHSGAGAATPHLLDLDHVLPHVDLVICHGGSATVHHAIAHGRPILALPTHLEQAMMALAVESIGAGRALPAPTARLEPVAALALATAMLSKPPAHTAHIPIDRNRPLDAALSWVDAQT